MPEEGFYVPGMFEMKDGKRVIKAPWAEKAFNEYLVANDIEPGIDTSETQQLRDAFASGWYSMAEARKFHGTDR